MSFFSAAGARTLPPRARLILSRQHTLRSRLLHQAQDIDYASKYAAKLQEKAKKENATVDELRQKVKLQEQEARKARLASAARHLAASPDGTSETAATGAGAGAGAAKIPKRKDSSPVKPLSSILSLPKLLQTPHTPAQINALWTAYHASRSGGTGRGYICASMPLETYERMLGVAAKWPSFILPLPREIPANAPTADGTTTTEKEKGHEFHYMQWATHDPPALPSAHDDSPFPPSTSPPALDPSLLGKQNPKTATIIFTPLLEYKLRQTFATPYLVLTFYTDLAHTHGVVLLRGEITPSPSGSGGKEWMLSQEDAQLLTMGLQRFYLWPVAAEGEKETAAAEVLRRFHEDAERFDWEDVVRLAGDVGV